MDFGAWLMLAIASAVVTFYALMVRAEARRLRSVEAAADRVEDFSRHFDLGIPCAVHDTLDVPLPSRS